MQGLLILLLPLATRNQHHATNTRHCYCEEMFIIQNLLKLCTLSNRQPTTANPTWAQTFWWCVQQVAFLLFLFNTAPLLPRTTYIHTTPPLLLLEQRLTLDSTCNHTCMYLLAFPLMLSTYWLVGFLTN